MTTTIFKRMQKFFPIIFALIPSLACGQETDSIVGRPYKSFETIAFCSYQTFHPSHYLTDNNWDILCAFTKPGKEKVLDSLGIAYNKSQLRLLEVGDLLSSDNGVYTTAMPIFGKQETMVIRNETKDFADSIFPIIEPKIKQLISAFNNAGYSKQSYSLIFSYLLDGYIWDDERLAAPSSCEDHGTWSGAYWAMFDKRKRVLTGTNAYGGCLRQNWTDDLGYWMGFEKMMALAKEIQSTKGGKIENADKVEFYKNWGIVDSDGNFLIPVIHRGNGNEIDVLCKSISSTLSDAVKQKCITWGTSHGIKLNRLAEVIFYHEVMWDLLDIFESKRLIVMPAILKGEEVSVEHKADNLFIVIDDSEE